MDCVFPLAELQSGFLGSFLSKGLKTNQLEVNTDEKTLRPIARLKEPRDLFALPKNKDHEFALQAPRWPVECQVVEERVVHIPYTNLRPEPYNIPGGLKPRPVGEENGIVVFNYNPIGAVNYEPKAKARVSRVESSDSDISSSESRNSSPDRDSLGNEGSKLKVKTSFTKLMSVHNQRSSSNSNDDLYPDDDSESVLATPNDKNVITPLISETSYPESTNNNSTTEKENSTETTLSTTTSMDTTESTVPETSSNIDDIWANNSTEYPPATPVFTIMPPKAQTLDSSSINISSAPNSALNEKHAIGDGVKTEHDGVFSPTDNATGIADGNKNPAANLEENAANEPAKKSVTKLQTELVITSGITESATTIGKDTANGADDTITNEEQYVALKVKTPILNDDVLKLYNDIISVTDSKSDTERKTKKTESNADCKQVFSDRISKMYLDLNVTEDAYAKYLKARPMSTAQNFQYDSELNPTNSLSVPQFSRSAINGSKIITNCHPCNVEEYDGLEFESRFESGNLAKAVKITKTYYELYLRPDLYTNRSKQWFYFRVRKMKKDVMYRFSIVNLVKSDSLYNEGMRPVMYSTIRTRLLREGWRRCGENICYYRNEDENGGSEEDDDSSYTLTFNIEFTHDDDTVYFAHSYPYTYTDLQDYLMAIQKNPVKSKFCKLRILCRTLAGNNVYYLTVTAPPKDDEDIKNRKCVVVSARVHPSETPASWMMKGLMDYITGETWIAKRLRNKFVFKLIPMLNPDGVIVGNTRNSLTGKDLNRQYRTVIRETYPSIWYTKALIKRLIEESGVAMYCDMHAHSRKHNIFLYGCENKRNPDKKLTEQVFPLMMHKNSADTFSFESCKFKVQRNKEGTGRIVVWMLGITNSYTIEASFGGSSLGARRGTHFNTADYENIGRTFCETLVDYCDEHPNKERLRLKIIERLLKEGSSAEEPLNISLSDYSSDEGHASSDSETEKKSSLKPSDLLEIDQLYPSTTTVLTPRDRRRLLYRRMRKIMHELDRIYFQPLFHKKYQQFLKSKQGKQRRIKLKMVSQSTKNILAKTSKAKENNDQKVIPNQTQNLNNPTTAIKNNIPTVNQNQSQQQNPDKNKNLNQKPNPLVINKKAPHKTTFSNRDQLENQCLEFLNQMRIQRQQTQIPYQSINEIPIQNTNSQAVQDSKTLANQSKTPISNQPLKTPNQNQNLSQVAAPNALIKKVQPKNESKDLTVASRTNPNPTIQIPPLSAICKPKKPTAAIDSPNQRIKVARTLRLFLEARKIMIRRKKRKSRKSSNKGSRSRGKRLSIDMPPTDHAKHFVCSTDDELCNSIYMPQSLMQSELQRRYIDEIKDNSLILNHKPPKLMITSPMFGRRFEKRKNADVDAITSPPTTAPTSTQSHGASPKTNLPRMRRTTSWHSLDGAESSPKTKPLSAYQYTPDNNKDELQMKQSPRKKLFGNVALDLTKGLRKKQEVPLLDGIAEAAVANLFAGGKTEKPQNTSQQKATEWDQEFLDACSDRILNLRHFSALLTSSTIAAASASPSQAAKLPRSLNTLMPSINLEQKTFRAYQQLNKLNVKASDTLSTSLNAKTRVLRKKNIRQHSPDRTTVEILSKLSKPHKSRTNLTMQRLKAGYAPTHTNPIHIKRTNNMLVQRKQQQLPAKTSGVAVTAMQPTDRRLSNLRSDNKPPIQQTAPTPTAFAIDPEATLAAPNPATFKDSTETPFVLSIKRKLKGQKNTALKAAPVKGDTIPATFTQAQLTTNKPAPGAGERVPVKLKKNGIFCNDNFSGKDIYKFN